MCSEGTVFVEATVVPHLKNSSKLLANPARHCRSAIVVALVLTSCIAIAAPLIAQGTANPTGAAVKEFLDRVKAYVELQNKQDGGLPSETPRSNNSNMEVRQRARAARIRLARATARPVDLFRTAGPFSR